jgi:cytochrome b561
VAQRVHELRRRVAERPASKRAAAGLLGLYAVTVALVLVGVLMAIGVRAMGEAEAGGQAAVQVSTKTARTPEAHQDPGRWVVRAPR